MIVLINCTSILCPFSHARTTALCTYHFTHTCTICYKLIIIVFNLCSDDYKCTSINFWSILSWTFVMHDCLDYSYWTIIIYGQAVFYTSFANWCSGLHQQLEWAEVSFPKGVSQRESPFFNKSGSNRAFLSLTDVLDWAGLKGNLTPTLILSC